MIVIYGIKDKLIPVRGKISDVIHTCMQEVLGLPEGKRAHRFISLNKEEFYYPSDRTDAYTVDDVKTAMCDAWDQYTIKVLRVLLQDKQGLLQTLKKCDADKFDAIALIRGGGTGLRIFDDIDIAATVVSMETPILTALGHAADHSFLDKVAGKSFTTPTALGHYLRDLCSDRLEAMYTSALLKGKDNEIDVLKQHSEYLQTDVDNWKQRAGRQREDMEVLKSANATLALAKGIKRYRLAIYSHTNKKPYEKYFIYP